MCEKTSNSAEIYSANFKTGDRTYFVNMLEAKNSTKYVKITESRKVGENEYQKNRVMLFQDDLNKLAKVLNQAIAKIEDEKLQRNAKLADEALKKTDRDITEAELLLYPNSGKKWTREDEEKLEFLFKAGKTIEDLSEIFGRKQKGIESRLAKIGLTE